MLISRFKENGGGKNIVGELFYTYNSLLRKEFATLKEDATLF